MFHSSLNTEPQLERYLAQVRRQPMLTEEEERALAKKYREQGDRSAAERLVTSHLRLVAKIAFGYRGYGLPTADLVSEGSLGMVKAVDHFEPDRGFRLSSYAQYWIRAQIQEYVLRSRSLVKMGTTGDQKKLFFNLGRLKAQLHEVDSGISSDGARKIAAILDVSENEVLQMNGRLSGGDSSLNATAGEEPAWQEHLADEAEDQESELIQRDELHQHRESLKAALIQLEHREQEVVRDRYLRDEPLSLAILAERYGVTRERVRQIEVRAIQKLKKAVH